MLIKNFALSAARPVTPLLSYPYVGTSRAENSLVRAVNELVPRGVPGREDIVQSLLLALHENKITREQLRDRKTVGQAIRVFMRENFEGAGYAV